LITFDDAPNVNSNPLPNHALRSGNVNAIETRRQEVKHIRIAMIELYKVLKIALITPSQKQAVKNKGEFCLYHQHNGHAILL
jgi:hypothetical protein